ncbi:hypothetical protein Leryth_009435 [Lithospermum erythrorhizon]|nr:hypothetical protein Leryth_009435 [Lithospermum erythrorhizon]
MSSSQLIPGLPNDVSLQCLARIPRYEHPIISLVCKSWKSSLHSHALFTTRSLLHISQPFLYLNLRIHNNFSWYLLIHKTPTKHVLVKLPSLPIHNVTNLPKTQLFRTNFELKSTIEASSTGNFNLAVRTPIEDSSGNLKNTHVIDVPKRQQIGTDFAVQTQIKPNEQNSYVKVEPFGLSHLINVPKRQPIGPSFAVLGSSIYMIGGSHDEIPSNSMWVFDCRFNVWEMGPKMRVGREFSAAGVVDGKIYVMGGCVVDNWARSMNWAEVFDPVKGEWAPVLSPIEVRDKWMHASAVIGGKVYAMADRGGVVYDVRKGEWGSVTKRLQFGVRAGYVVVLYCYDYLGKIRGYDVGEDRWKELRGVEKGLPKFLCGATMVNFDGRLCVVWEGKGSGKEVEIMCAEIEVKKDVDGGLSGVILWSDVILVVPNSSSIVQCLVVEV